MKSQIAEAYEKGGAMLASRLICDTYNIEGNVSKAAQALGVTQPTLQYWISRLGLKFVKVLTFDQTAFYLTKKGKEYLASEKKPLLAD